MNPTKGLLLLGLLCCQVQQTYAQSLPSFSIDRRMDVQYMDSVARLARRQYQLAAARPPAAHTDTLRFQALYYLGRLYNWWESRQDSSLYYADKLTQQARLRRNAEFEVKGLLTSEFYYHDVRTNYPKALQLNYQARAVLQRARQDPLLNWRIELNLGALYIISGDYDNALKFLTNARLLIDKGSGLSVPVTRLNQADIEEKIGILYEEQGNFPESEKHYLAAEKILSGVGLKTNLGFIYEVLSALYLKEKAYSNALIYARKAEQLWESIAKPYSITNNWSILAVGYAGTGQNDLALHYARQVLNKPLILPARQRAYLALQKLYENQQDWQQSLFYYQKYVALSDTIQAVNQGKKLASFQRKSELELLSLQNQQTQKLQIQRLLTVEKQAELNRLRARASTTALTQKALLTEQQRLVENARAQTALTRQKAEQKLQQQTYAQQTQVQQRTRTGLIAGLVGVLLFTLALLIVYGKNRMQQRQIAWLNADLEQTVQTRTAELVRANAELLLKNQAIREADARIIAVQESERQRIAADLHDDLGGTLATLGRRLTDLRPYLAAPDGVRQFEALQPLIQKGSADLRRITHNLMPPEFGRIGLRSAIEQLVRSQPLFPTRFSYVTSGSELRLPLATELNAYRIVSELIQNINKHAQANRAAVQVLYHDDRLTITVEDDGLGNRAIAPADESAGIGLKTSRLRADYMGGANLWRDVSAGGTLVVLEVPYAVASESDR